MARERVPVRVGHLAFGLAFAIVGVAWLLRPAGLDIGGAWLAAVAVLVLGLAGLAATLGRLRR